MRVKIGTRSSALALWQANYIAKRLKNEQNIDSEIIKIQTTGDKILDRPLDAIGGKGLFVKELEVALKSGEIDVAVHSLKDVPVNLDEDLPLVAITERDSYFDVFLSKKYKNMFELPRHAKVGTTSARRSLQLKILRSDLDTQSLRGNVQTRLSRLEEGSFDAIVLAHAGLKRLDVLNNKFHAVILSSDLMIPAMGQGALGLQMLKDNKFYTNISALNCTKSALLCGIEREFVRLLGGTCQSPLGVLADVTDGIYSLVAILGIDKTHIKGQVKSPNYETLASTLAQDFINRGARI
ncbi:MAG: hydroxymethylbilane synthase [Helicobacter sp.]|nr:hydroxymethylbilane synthase [Helicobacter sp.]